MSRKLFVITSSRADYGIQKNLLIKINNDDDFDLQLVVTGSHLSEKYGNTINEIRDDGFAIGFQVDIVPTTTAETEIAKSFGDGVFRFTELFSSHRPDMVMILGDRYEIFAATIAAYMLRIPIIHLHGGETTEGAYDEAFRHSITKMSQLHLVATEEYRKRVIQLGEHPDTVFNVGSLAVNNRKQMNLLNKEDVEKKLGLKFMDKNLLVTFHPETLGDDSSVEQMMELLSALEVLDDTMLLFTLPNADTGADNLTQLLKAFVKSRDHAHLFSSLGVLLYFSTLQIVDAVVGNSSSGLIEVPSFRKGTINIGDRQKGRIRAASVIDCPPDCGAIKEALAELYSVPFIDSLGECKNPYEKPDTDVEILEILRKTDTFNLKKSFFDIDYKMGDMH